MQKTNIKEFPTFLKKILESFVLCNVYLYMEKEPENLRKEKEE